MYLFLKFLNMYNTTLLLKQFHLKYLQYSFFITHTRCKFKLVVMD